MVLLVYAVAFAIPVVLLYFFRSAPWIIHLLSVAAAVALGFAQIPDQWKGRTFDMAFGGFILFLLVWGIGGLLPPVRHHHHYEKHA